ncbi:HAMP domain protein [Marvinbryantia formatexigens DSM 14469]|uniref:HAMP domain protein n=2 Tax=Marvinbryantia TaxID=248744 RepID=C6LB51_9FIRM|nr:HAMP domain protein [Marvinbryantia formatexigens DSM 14469]
MAIRQIEEQIAKSNRASLLVYYNTLRDEITGTEIFMTEKVHSQETKKRILESFAEELSNNPDVAAYMLYDTAKRESDSVYNSIVGYGRIKEEIQNWADEMMESAEFPLGWFLKEIGSRTFLCRVMRQEESAVIGIYDLTQAAKNAKLSYAYAGEIVFFQKNQILANEEFTDGADIKLDYEKENGYYFSENRKYMIVQQQLLHFKMALVSPFFENGILRFLYLSPYIYIGIGLLAIWIMLKYWQAILFEPLDRLIGAMHQVQEGNLQVRLEEQRGLEFQKVQESFNSMVAQIASLKIKSYEEQIEKERAQMHALRMQIQPHFFLNCLKSIVGLAQQQKTGQIQKAVVYLGVHLRYIFDLKSDEIALAKELSMCENYIALHQSIEKGKAEIHISMDERMKNINVPPVSILTLVENSMKYAMACDGKLKIEIIAKLLEIDETYLADITVSDNGPGFSEELLQELNKNLDASAMIKGVGLRNVIRRFRLIYGEEFAVQFSNCHGARINVMFQVERGEKNAAVDSG